LKAKYGSVVKYRPPVCASAEERAQYTTGQVTKESECHCPHLQGEIHSVSANSGTAFTTFLF